MVQPTVYEITNRLNEIINNKITREDVGRWALEFIKNDDYIEIENIEAWHYLVIVSSIDEMITPDEYLYSIKDIECWIQERNR